MDRYSRQTILAEIGQAGQEKLRRASVLCIGAGGLGAPALLYLAAAGIGRIGIADFDDIAESNLQRQILYKTSETGQAKAERAREHLLALNPNIEIEIFPEGLHAQNAQRLFSAYDIILDGTDNFAAKFLISDAGVKFGKPVIYGAINRFEGQVAVFDSAHGPCYRCLYPQEPREKILNCTEAGIIGAVAGMTGITQAMQAIMLACPHESFKPLKGKLWIIDAKTMQSRILDIPKDPACPLCSKEKDKIMLEYNAPACAADKEIGIDDLPDLQNPHLVDVREQEEWDAGHIPGAVHFPLSALMQGKTPELPEDRPVVLYCHKGMRSLQALEILAQQDFKNLRSLSGGYAAWCMR